MIQQDICPFTYVVPPAEEYFFTDASLTRDDFTFGGTYGFVYIDQTRITKDKFVGYSVISDIHYLECKAIYFCLCYIYWLPKRDLYTEYYIFTDSSTCYESLNKLKFKESIMMKEESWLHRQLRETRELMKFITRSGISIRLIDVKSHTTSKKQKQYLKSKGFDFDSSYVRLITQGNKQIDQLVGNVDRNKNQYPYLLYDN